MKKVLIVGAGPVGLIIGCYLNKYGIDFDIIDKFIKVSDEESAHTTRELAKKEGLFVGYTSGAAFQAVKQYAEEGEFDANSKVVIIFPDHGSRYMSKVFRDDWMSEQGFFDSVNQEAALKIEIIK